MVLYFGFVLCFLLLWSVCVCMCGSFGLPQDFLFVFYSIKINSTQCLTITKLWNVCTHLYKVIPLHIEYHSIENKLNVTFVFRFYYKWPLIDRFSTIPILIFSCAFFFYHVFNDYRCLPTVFQSFSSFKGFT